MVTLILHCPHCGSKALVRDGHAPTANRSSPLGDSACKRKNAVTCVASRARSGSPGLPCRFGLQKSSLASSFTDYPACP
jgi:hypothetical protein